MTTQVDEVQTPPPPAPSTRKLEWAAGRITACAELIQEMVTDTEHAARGPIVRAAEKILLTIGTGVIFINPAHEASALASRIDAEVIRRLGLVTMHDEPWEPVRTQITQLAREIIDRAEDWVQSSPS
ncbi:hypothetical protein AB0G15_05770 [Streptosporangium sp. NPDC023825]|uniref:hypothetical protein n=1 Tax=Streptosporangium sp. NPDC023825 TaxID=3154909 RepID=UPI003439B2ED